MAAQLDYRPGVTVLSQVARTLRNSPSISAESKQEADKLIAESGASQRAGDDGEARRSLSHAIAILRGVSWDQTGQFDDSLVLRPNDVVADASLPFVVELSQSFAARFLVDSSPLVNRDRALVGHF